MLARSVRGAGGPECCKTFPIILLSAQNLCVRAETRSTGDQLFGQHRSDRIQSLYPTPSESDRFGTGHGEDADHCAVKIGTLSDSENPILTSSPLVPKRRDSLRYLYRSVPGHLPSSQGPRSATPSGWPNTYSLLHARADSEAKPAPVDSD